MNYKSTLHISLILIALLGGCTKEIQVGPDTTYDTDWTPTFHIDQNRYECLQYHIDAPPRLTINRNILSLSLQYRPAGYPVFLTKDTFNLKNVNYASNILLTTKPFLTTGYTYVIREKVLFTDLTSRTSQETTIISPGVKGIILKRLDTNPGLFQSPKFSFDGQYIYAFEERWVYRIDTSRSHSEEYLGDLVPDNPSHGYFRSSLYRTRACMAEYPDSTNSITVNVVDLLSFTTIRSFSIRLPSRNLVGDMCYDGTSLFMVWTSISHPRSHIVKYNAEDGRVIAEYPENNTGYPGFLFSDGENLWMHYRGDLDNRFQRIDPVTFAVLEEDRNPILNSNTANWNGGYVWVYEVGDYHSGEYSGYYSFVKIKLDGM